MRLSVMTGLESLLELLRSYIRSVFCYLEFQMMHKVQTPAILSYTPKSEPLDSNHFSCTEIDVFLALNYFVQISI
jgi:hypothetical protein